MAEPKKPTQYLKIPIEGDDIAGSARNLRKSLLALQQMALDNIDADFLRRGDLESMRTVTDLMIRLQEIEENAATKSESPP